MRTTASSKEAGCIKADVVSNGEMCEPSDETYTGRKKIFEVSKTMQAFLQSAFCRSKPADNKITSTWIEQFSVPEGMRSTARNWTAF